MNNNVFQIPAVLTVAAGAACLVFALVLAIVMLFTRHQDFHD